MKIIKSKLKDFYRWSLNDTFLIVGIPFRLFIVLIISLMYLGTIMGFIYFRVKEYNFEKAKELPYLYAYRYSKSKYVAPLYYSTRIYEIDELLELDSCKDSCWNLSSLEAYNECYNNSCGLIKQKWLLKETNPIYPKIYIQEYLLDSTIAEFICYTDTTYYFDSYSGFINVKKLNKTPPDKRAMIETRMYYDSLDHVKIRRSNRRWN